MIHAINSIIFVKSAHDTIFSVSFVILFIYELFSQMKRKKFSSEFAIRCDTLNIADVRMVSNYLHLPLLHSR